VKIFLFVFSILLWIFKYIIITKPTWIQYYPLYYTLSSVDLFLSLFFGLYLLLYTYKTRMSYKNNKYLLFYNYIIGIGLFLYALPIITFALYATFVLGA